MRKYCTILDKKIYFYADNRRLKSGINKKDIPNFVSCKDMSCCKI